MHEAALACDQLTRGVNRRSAYLSEVIMSKSECMRFVHSRGDLDSLCRSDSLDRCGDLGCIVELGPFGEPRSVLA
jgi:hypothetical protein